MSTDPKKLNFEMNEKNLGRPLYWHLDAHIKAIEQMIMADELQIALQMVDQVPAWYRANPPRELQEIKQILYRQTYDNFEYCHDDEEANCTREFGEGQWSNGYMFPRAEIMKELVRQETGAWIFDLGCSHGNLPLGLMKEGLVFNYFGQAMNGRILEKVKEWTKDHWQERPDQGQTSILYCTEVIEHCFDPQSVVHSAYKLGVDYDLIVLSVPNGCLGGGLPDWKTRRVGHVRGWNVQEFLKFASTEWPGYAWSVYESISIVLVGRRAGL